MLKVSAQRIFEKLDAVYQRAMGARTDRVFFQSIYDYIEAFDSEPDLVAVNVQFAKTANQDLRIEVECEEKAQREILEVSETIERYLLKHEIQNNTVRASLLHVGEAWREERLSSVGKTREMFDSLTYALMRLVEMEGKTHYRFCRHFGSIDKNGGITDWNQLSPSFNQWIEESGKNARLLELKAWYAWDQVVGFHNHLRDFEQERRQLRDERKHWELGHVVERHRVFSTAIAGENLGNTTVTPIKREAFERYLSMVHTFIRDTLTAVPDKSAEPLSWDYNADTGQLNVGGNHINFKPTSNRGKVLKIFLSRKTTRTTKRHWEEVSDSICGADTGVLSSEKKRHVVFYAIDGINTRISKVLQTGELLIYRDGYVWLNTSFPLG